jgi:hypothetical protein
MVTHQLGVLSIQLPASCEVKQQINDDSRKEWMIKYGNDSIIIQYVYNDSGEWTAPDQYGYDTERSMSLYDTYLSTSPMEKEQYKITYPAISGYKARMVSRTYTTGKEFVEVSFKHICDAPSVIQITGDISPETREEISKMLNTLQFNCN